MDEVKTGGPAFPSLLLSENYATGNTVGYQSEPGLTLRDYFAAKAMQGLIAQSSGTALSSELTVGATYAYQMADAMLAAQETQNG